MFIQGDDWLSWSVLAATKPPQKNDPPKKIWTLQSLKLTYLLKINGLKMRIPLKWSLFRGYVSFREDTEIRNTGGGVGSLSCFISLERMGLPILR